MLIILLILCCVLFGLAYADYCMIDNVEHFGRCLTLEADKRRATMRAGEPLDAVGGPTAGVRPKAEKLESGESVESAAAALEHPGETGSENPAVRGTSRPPLQRPSRAAAPGPIARHPIAVLSR